MVVSRSRIISIRLLFYYDYDYYDYDYCYSSSVGVSNENRFRYDIPGIPIVNKKGYRIRTISIRYIPIVNKKKQKIEYAPLRQHQHYHQQHQHTFRSFFVQYLQTKNTVEYQGTDIRCKKRSTYTIYIHRKIDISILSELLTRYATLIIFIICVFWRALGSLAYERGWCGPGVVGASSALCASQRLAGGRNWWRALRSPRQR